MNTIEAKIKELKAAAKANGLDVRFRNHRTEQGDFCIFIYDKTFRKTYAVGFDGNWKSDTTDFDFCLRQAYRWIERRDKRFEKVDGKWIYKGQ
jgi:hypothetical protein